MPTRALGTVLAHGRRTCRPSGALAPFCGSGTGQAAAPIGTVLPPTSCVQVVAGASCPAHGRALCAR